MQLPASGCVISNGDKLAFQRRDNNAPTNPNKLALFGGANEPGEEPGAAAIRELREETSLGFEDHDVTFLFSYFRDDVDRMQYIYRLETTEIDFDVYEGEGVEWRTIEQVLSSDDTTDGLRVAIMKFSDYLEEKQDVPTN